MLKKNILLGTKTNFSPTPKDNLIITYSEVIENFDFQTLLTTDNELYSSIDQLSSKPLSKNLEPFQAKNPYEVKATFTWLFTTDFDASSTLFALFISGNSSRICT